MSDDHSKKDQVETGAEDTEAILSRRDFLIKSGLATAGVAAVGCGEKQTQKPQPCLSQPARQPDAETARPCLKVRAQQDAGAARPCLKIKPPPPQPCLKPPAQPCLSPKPPPRPKPRPCLSVPAPKKP